MPDSPIAADERFRAFVLEVLSSRMLWALTNDAGLAYSRPDEPDEGPVLLVWSDAANASAVAAVRFPDYHPAPFTLEQFSREVLPYLRTQRAWLCINPSPDLGGIELPVAQFEQALPARVT